MKKVGKFLMTYVLTPIMLVMALTPMVLGFISSAMWYAFKGGWDAVDKA